MIESVAEQRKDVLDYFLKDSVGNGFAIEDFRQPPKDGELYIDRADALIRGHVMNHYEGREVFVDLKGETYDVVKELLDFLPLRKGFKCYISTEPKYREILRDFLSSKGEMFVELDEYLMALRRGEAKRVEPNQAVIVPERYAAQVAQLITDSNSDEAVEVNRIALSGKKIWGIIVDERVVAVAAIASKQPEIACLVNVVTHPDFRRRGFGASVTSAATSDALKISEVCSLFASTNNFDAIRIYERLGYRFYANSVKFELHN